MGNEERLAIAETDLNLAKYSKTQQITDRLPLTKMQDPTGFDLSDDDYIEIIVKTNLIEGDVSTPKTSVLQQQLSSSSVGSEPGVGHQSQPLNASSSILSTTVIMNADESIDQAQQKKELQTIAQKSEKSVGGSSLKELKEKFKEQEKRYKHQISVLN